MIAGDCNLGIVQALLIMVHWKAPTDKSAWVKLGIAIRLSYQLDLHVVRLEPLPADEIGARKIRAAERTWFGECFFICLTIIVSSSVLSCSYYSWHTVLGDRDLAHS
jgi:hypothetical protein